MPAFRLAHCSDPHLPWDVRWPGFGGLWSKRSLSQYSWASGRGKLQLPAVLAMAVADLQAHAPDHVVVTGDITNFSFPGEFEAAARWLETLGDPRRVSVIPGNHDALVPVPWPEGLGHWQRWMSSDEPASGASEPDRFPYVQLRGEIALIGLSSAIPTAPGFASGELGNAQLERLERILKALAERGLCRIVMLHHPPAERVVRARKALRDRAAFRAVLRRAGAELILHGHSRDARFDPIPGPQGLIASLGLPSFSAIPNPKDEGSRWHLLELEGNAGRWRCTVTARVLNAARNGYVTTSAYRLLLTPMRDA